MQLQGVLDASSVAELEEVMSYLLTQKHARFVMDLTNVNFISSAGWGVFIGELKKIRNQKGDIKLSGMQPEVLDVFMLLELDHLIEAHPTVDEAIAAFLKDMPEEVHQAHENAKAEVEKNTPESKEQEKAEPELDPDDIAADEPVDLLETMDDDELEEYEEDFLELFGEQLPEEEDETGELSLPMELEEQAEDAGEDVDDLDALEALEKLKKLTASKEAQPQAAEEEEETAAPAQANADESPAAEALETQAAEKSRETPVPMEKTTAPPQEPASLNNPFDITDVSDPWLGGVDLDYNEGWEGEKADTASISGSLSAGIFSDLVTGEYLEEESAVSVDGWSPTPLEEAVFRWDASDNGGKHNTEKEAAKAAAEQSKLDPQLQEKIRKVVVAHPEYGPSAIRNHLLTEKLIEPKVTRSKIYRTLVELDLDTREKRRAYAQSQSK